MRLQRGCRSAGKSAQQAVGAGDSVRPSVRLAPDCLFCSDTAAVASQTHFFCLARKSGQKEALENDLWRLRADSLQRPVRAQDCYFSDSLWFREMYHKQSRIADIRFWFCSFAEYPTDYGHVLCPVGADAHIGPFGNHRIRRRFSLKRCVLRGPMWASAPTNTCKETNRADRAVRPYRTQYMTIVGRVFRK